VEFHSSRFAWYGKAGQLTAEASSLGFPPGSWPARITVVSARTGRREQFAAGRPSLDSEGDLMWVDYFGNTCTVRVYND
jgi:hypothetical protein